VGIGGLYPDSAWISALQHCAAENGPARRPAALPGASPATGSRGRWQRKTRSRRHRCLGRGRFDASL